MSPKLTLSLVACSHSSHNAMAYLSIYVHLSIQCLFSISSSTELFSNSPEVTGQSNVGLGELLSLGAFGSPLLGEIAEGIIAISDGTDGGLPNDSGMPPLLSPLLHGWGEGRGR